jgi:hypothetical protein
MYSRASSRARPSSARPSSGSWADSFWPTTSRGNDINAVTPEQAQEYYNRFIPQTPETNQRREQYKSHARMMSALEKEHEPRETRTSTRITAEERERGLERVHSAVLNRRLNAQDSARRHDGQIDRKEVSRQLDNPSFLHMNKRLGVLEEDVATDEYNNKLRINAFDLTSANLAILKEERRKKELRKLREEKELRALRAHREKEEQMNRNTGGGYTKLTKIGLLARIMNIKKKAAKAAKAKAKPTTRKPTKPTKRPTKPTSRKPTKPTARKPTIVRRK